MHLKWPDGIIAARPFFIAARVMSFACAQGRGAPHPIGADMAVLGSGRGRII
jgi:hypothetical protein